MNDLELADDLELKRDFDSLRQVVAEWAAGSDLARHLVETRRQWCARLFPRLANAMTIEGDYFEHAPTAQGDALVKAIVNWLDTNIMRPLSFDASSGSLHLSLTGCNHTSRGITAALSLTRRHAPEQSRFGIDVVSRFFIPWAIIDPPPQADD